MEPPSRWRDELWRAARPASRAHAVVLASLCLAGLAYQLLLRDWYVEDAAISFAYARNLAEGHGLVPYVGGERVEGYSNPTWVALLACGELLGIDGFAGSKALAAGLFAFTLLGVYAVTREAVGARHPHASLAAAALYAVNAQATIWGLSGLENPLFSALLVLGTWTLAVEARTRHRWPLSAFVFLALALTRPEGVAYAAVAFGFSAAFSLADGRGLGPALRWLAVFVGPFLASEAARLAYFAWPQPNTAYGKLGARTPDRLLVWDSEGWQYLRAFGRASWRSFLAPLFLLGLFGERRRILSLGVGAGCAALLLTDGPSAAFEPARVGLGWAVVALLPLVAAWGRRPRLLVVLAAFAGCAAGFAVLANGDWMRNYRWFATFAVPGSVLLGVGLWEAAAWVRARAWVAGALVTVGGLAVAVPDARTLREWPELVKITPQMVHARALLLSGLAARLGIDERPSLLTVDQGGFAWWSGFEMMDKGALIDVAVAHNRDRGLPFFKHYVLEDRRPMFLAGHQFVPDWMKDRAFAEAYLAFKNRNEQYAVRRDLVFVPAWDGPDDRERDLGGGITLVGWEIGSPEVSGRVAVTVGLHVLAERHVPEAILLDVLAADGTAVARFELPADSGFIPPKSWKDDVYLGRATLALEGVPPGRYGLGISVRTVRGGMRRGAAGASQFPEAITVVTPAEAATAADSDLEAARERAAAGACDAAEQAWSSARAHVLDQPAWTAARAAPTRSLLAGCWVARGADADLRRARALAPTDPEVVAACRRAADAAELRGAAAWRAARWWDAFAAYDLAVKLVPTRSWSRRWAEEARGRALSRRR